VGTAASRAKSPDHELLEMHERFLLKRKAEKIKLHLPDFSAGGLDAASPMRQTRPSNASLEGHR
jgi:hypothetical protein